MPETEITGGLFLLARETVNYAPEPTVSPEAHIVERIEAGDGEAFAELFRRFAPMVHGIALSRVPRAEADDLVQEVFISVHKNLNSLRDRNAVGPWLAKIARNRAANYYRSARPSDELNDEIAAQTGISPDSVRVNLHRGMKMLREKLGVEVKK